MIKVETLRKVVDKVYNSPVNKKNRRKMNRYLKYYTGEFWSKRELKNKEESGIFVNLIFSTVMTIAPLLTDNKPKGDIRARLPFFQKYIENFKDAADCLWDIEEMDMKLFDACLCALIMKIGYFKVFFDPNKDEMGEVSITVVDPREFVMSVGCQDIWDASWCGEIMVKPLDWVRRNFPEKGKKVKPDTLDNEVDYEHLEDYELSSEMATIYSIWIKDDEAMEYIEQVVDNGEIKSKKVKKKSESGSWIATFAKGYDEFLELKPYKYNHKKPPYIPLYDTKIPFNHMGMGEIDQLETINLEFNLLIKKLAKHVRMYADPNWVIDAACGLDPEMVKEKLPGGGNVWTINTGSTPPVALNGPSFNPSGMELLGSLPKLGEEVTGVTDITKGVAGKKERQSAHEISALLETSYTRTRQRIRNIEWTIKRIYILIIEIMQEYYTETHIFGRTNESGHEWLGVSNSPDFAKQMSAPREIPEGEEITPGDQQSQKDYEALIDYLTDKDSVHAKFDVIVETNSTLPLDKQSLANLCLQLADLNLTPNSGIDLETLLEVIRFPHKEKVLERLKAAQQNAMKAQQQKGVA